MGRKLKTTEEWFEGCKSKREDKCANISLTENSVYKGKNFPIELGCTKHHIVFSYLADSFERRNAMCPECLKESRGTDFKSWEVNARKVHGDEFEYLNLEEEYKDGHSMITMRCSRGHVFKQYASSHLRGYGCKECYHESLRQPRYTLDDYLKMEHKKFGNKFDLSKFVFNGMHEKSIYICHCKDCNGNEHGEYEQTPSDHIRAKTGCPYCGNELIAESQRSNTEEFISKAKKIWGDDYIYDNVNYISARDNIEVICAKCGRGFLVTPDNHLRGEGCSHCNKSKLERKVAKFFDENGIIYEKNYMDGFENLRNDFYISKYNVIVECQGTQHFRPTYFGNYSIDRAKENCEYTISCDIRKNKIANNLGIRILYFMDKYNFKEEYLDNERYNKIYNNYNLITDMNELLEKIKGEK